eukprot:1157711-Pelagomonas_calceolata.AAC.8
MAQPHQTPGDPAAAMKSTCLISRTVWLKVPPYKSVNLRVHVPDRTRAPSHPCRLSWDLLRGRACLARAARRKVGSWPVESGGPLCVEAERT